MQKAQETRSGSLGWDDSPGVGNSNPLQYSGLENYTDSGDCQAIVHGVEKSQTCWACMQACLIFSQLHVIHEVIHQDTKGMNIHFYILYDLTLHQIGLLWRTHIRTKLVSGKEWKFKTPIRQGTLSNICSLLTSKSALYTFTFNMAWLTTCNQPISMTISEECSHLLDTVAWYVQTGS